MSLHHIVYVNFGVIVSLGVHHVATQLGLSPIVTAGEMFVFGAVMGLALSLDFEDAGS